MAHGNTSKSETAQVFRDRVTDLEDKAAKQSKYFRTHSGPRPWHTPESMLDVGLLYVPGLHEPAWNRDKINEKYAELLDDTGNGVGAVCGLAHMKIQCEYMAVEERAWRLRHASMIRCACVAHGKLDLHSKPKSSPFTRVLNVATNAKTKGNDDATDNLKGGSE